MPGPSFLFTSSAYTPLQAGGGQRNLTRYRVGIGQGALLGMSRGDGFTDGLNTIQGVRTYDSNAGTWTTPDVYAGDVHDPASQKSYMWNNNNPITYSDPTGFSAVPDVDYMAPPDTGPPDPNGNANAATAKGGVVADVNGQPAKIAASPQGSSDATVQRGTLRAIGANAVDVALQQAKGELTAKTLSNVLHLMEDAEGASNIHNVPLAIAGNSIIGHNSMGNSIKVTMTDAGFSITENYGHTPFSPTWHLQWEAQNRATAWDGAFGAGHSQARSANSPARLADDLSMNGRGGSDHLVQIEHVEISAWFHFLLSSGPLRLPLWGRLPGGHHPTFRWGRSAVEGEVFWRRWT